MNPSQRLHWQARSQFPRLGNHHAAGEVNFALGPAFARVTAVKERPVRGGRVGAYPGGVAVWKSGINTDAAWQQGKIGRRNVIKVFAKVARIENSVLVEIGRPTFATGEHGQFIEFRQVHRGGRGGRIPTTVFGASVVATSVSTTGSLTGSQAHKSKPRIRLRIRIVLLIITSVTLRSIY